jgi:urease accessory protein
MQTDSVRASSAKFAANRAQGAVRFGVHLQDGVTRRGDLHESGSLRVRFPSPEQEGLSGVFVTPPAGSPAATVLTSTSRWARARG